MSDEGQWKIGDKGAIKVEVKDVVRELGNGESELLVDLQSAGGGSFGWVRVHSGSVFAHPALLREQCFKDMYRFVENCRRDCEPNVSAYDTLTVMLQTLNDCGSEGFGDSGSMLGNSEQ